MPLHIYGKNANFQWCCIFLEKELLSDMGVAYYYFLLLKKRRSTFMGITVQKHFSNVTATTSKRLQVRSDVIVKQFLPDTQKGPTDKIENETFDFQLCLGKSSAGSTGITYVFLFFLPFTITIFPTLYIYILLIRSRMDFSSDTKNNTKVLKCLEIPTWGTLRLWWGHEFS